MNIDVDDFVCLTDDQTIEDMMESNIPNATAGLQLRISKILHIREKDGLCDWYICKLDGNMPDDYPDLWLFIKMVDNERDFRIYWQPDDFQYARNRRDLINDNILWLFKQPDDLDNFRPCDLEFTNWMDLTDESSKSLVKFDIKGSELYGECFEDPVPSGLRQPQPAIVVEYSTSNVDVDDTEILIVELGGLDKDGNLLEDGGVVHYFLGGSINNSDIDFIKH